MKASLLKIIIIQCLTSHWSAGARTNILTVEQPSFLKVTVGKSATFNCSFVTVSPTFTLKWTLCCGDNTPLEKHLVYKDRVILGPSYKEITIINLSEQDTEKYCCHVQTGHGEEGNGNGTLLQVVPDIKYPAGPGIGGCTGNLWLLMEILRLVLLTFIIILLSIIVKKLS
ncbi:hypothetical protein AB205_0197150 [Aquarana catesbeiana]|uniref:Ig-like domain-containing protein n=1 Tax=Aquarana catesbeiana TaxID=8400 RepID=A0A2G9RX54_AQUCT|nr:hypothetical protein AB205_0197150 [Aquarana catesbeiana]